LFLLTSFADKIGVYTNDELQKLSDEDKRKQSHSIQMQAVILDSDQKKLIAERTLLESEIRQTQTKQERLRIEMEEKKRKSAEVSRKIAQNEDELKNIRKRLNAVH
jgi:chromosome segregation ATPase